MPIELLPLEHNVMEMLLAGEDSILKVLREQYRAGYGIHRERTETGFYLTFSIPSATARLEGRKSLHFGDVKADINGLKYGAGFVLHVRDGVIDYLEGYSYDEPWPVNVERFCLTYLGGNERDLAALWRNWA